MAQVHFNFQKTNFDYSMKNIGVPTKMEYLMSLTHQVRSFVDRVRWRAFHILNPTNRESKETFGFNTISSSPKVEALEKFYIDINDFQNQFYVYVSTCLSSRDYVIVIPSLADLYISLFNFHSHTFGIT